MDNNEIKNEEVINNSFDQKIVPITLDDEQINNVEPSIANEVQNEESKQVNQPKNKKNSLLLEILDYLKTIIITVIVVLIISNFVFRPIEVDGDSMHPTLVDRDKGFTSIISKQISGLERFDIVTAYLLAKDELIVKRLIGFPGDKIEIKNDILYINDEEIDEYYLDQDFIEEYKSTNNRPFTSDYGPLVLGEDEYFLLGDNRPVSADSRYFGVFSKEDIKSKYIFIFWPLNHFGGK